MNKFCMSRRLDSIFMDITKNILLRLDKNKIPTGLVSSLYPGKFCCFDIFIEKFIFYRRRTK